MSVSLAVFLLIVGFVVGSMVYVYRFRGQERYKSAGEYWRKGWPIFSPLNCLLYLFTKKRARAPIMDREQFPELQVIQDNWETIRQEALGLYEDRVFDQTSDPDSSAYYDIGFRTFQKYGWSKFYLKWYGTKHNSAQSSCPETLKILDQVPSVNGAMFSILPVGSQLTRHADPVACSLRYHLGLATPNDDRCYINIDGRDYSWRDGDDLIFDETYLHYAHNDADQYRLILMCDVERPTWLLGRVINFFYKGLMRLTVVPNMDGDQRGFANNLFARISPALARVRELKKTNRRQYKALKYSVNALLALALGGVLLGGLMALDGLVAFVA
ncbi:aspartyl/asparaginyl beta-hydroxylase domain-containing protein [Halomonadaceae bacterium KBTZ08]